MDIKKYRMYDVKHWQNIALYMRKIQREYFKMLDNITHIYSQIPQDVPFDIINNPLARADIRRELIRLSNEIRGTIFNGVLNEWMLSNSKNDMLLNSMLKNRNLPESLKNKWMGRNLDALEAFQKSKIKGMNLSDRVWNTVAIEKYTIQDSIAIGILNGTPATELARDMKQYLIEPDRLYRKIKNAEGKLILSRPASEYHPGAGVYRSGYKNALRMTRTETNRSYQQADNKRWENQDFVLGVRVQRSNNPYDCDICEAGAGDYPKGYKWEMFHPNCRCTAVPILADEDDFMKSVEAGFEQEDYEFHGQIADIPKSFKTYMKNNSKYEHIRGT